MSSRTLGFAAFLTALSLAAVSALPLSAPRAQAAAAPRPVLTVTTVSAQPLTLALSLTANGNIAAWQEAVIGAETAGLRLADIRANVGDHVKAGDVLAVFDDETVQAELTQARASVAEARANAAAAAADAARGQALKNSGAMSAQQISQYVTSAQAAQARVDVAQATLATRQYRAKHTRVLAPDDGVISARTATLGAVSTAGTELFRMIRQGRLEWRAEVTSAELGLLRPGTSVQVQTASGARLTGTVRMIAPTVDVQTRASLVYVDLPPAPADGPPASAGMFAQGRFLLGTDTALAVPQEAVILRDGFSYVFRIDDASEANGVAPNGVARVTQVKVETGRRQDDQVEITQGLPADARVVLTGAAFLQDGDQVRVVATPTPANAPAARP